jgi:hypothetical protein
VRVWLCSAVHRQGETLLPWGMAFIAIRGAAWWALPPVITRRSFEPRRRRSHRKQTRARLMAHARRLRRSRTQGARDPRSNLSSGCDRLHSDRLPVEEVIKAGPFVDGRLAFHTFKSAREFFRSPLFRRPIGQMARRANEIDKYSGAAHNPTPDLRAGASWLRPPCGRHPISGRRTPLLVANRLIALFYPRFR